MTGKHPRPNLHQVPPKSTGVTLDQLRIAVGATVISCIIVAVVAVLVNQQLSRGNDMRVAVTEMSEESLTSVANEAEPTATVDASSQMATDETAVTATPTATPMPTETPPPTATPMPAVTLNLVADAQTIYAGSLDAVLVQVSAASLDQATQLRVTSNQNATFADDPNNCASGTPELVVDNFQTSTELFLCPRTVLVSVEQLQLTATLFAGDGSTALTTATASLAVQSEDLTLDLQQQQHIGDDTGASCPLPEPFSQETPVQPIPAQLTLQSAVTDEQRRYPVRVSVLSLEAGIVAYALDANCTWEPLATEGITLPVTVGDTIRLAVRPANADQTLPEITASVLGADGSPRVTNTLQLQPIVVLRDAQVQLFDAANFFSAGFVEYTTPTDETGNNDVYFYGTAIDSYTSNATGTSVNSIQGRITVNGEPRTVWVPYQERGEQFIVIGSTQTLPTVDPDAEATQDGAIAPGEATQEAEDNQPGGNQ